MHWEEDIFLNTSFTENVILNHQFYQFNWAQFCSCMIIRRINFDILLLILPDIEPNQPILVNINQLNTSVIVRNLSVDISYVTCQVHSQTKDLTLSSSPTPGIGRSITGVDLGMVIVLEANQTEVTWYIMSNQSQDVQALVAVFPISGNGN